MKQTEIDFEIDFEAGRPSYKKALGTVRDERVRLSRHADQIDTLFARNGRVSNVELAEVCIRYSARIFELRKLGRDIRIIERDRRTGLVLYELFR